jgi:hypothetical protein
MQFVWRRYARSGYAPSLFYYAIAIGFIGLAVWAAARGDWVVMVLAILMAPATYAGSRVMRRLNEAQEISRREIAAAAKNVAAKKEREV